MTAKEGFVWFLPAYISLKLNETKNHTDGLDGMSDCSRFIDNILKDHFALSYANFGNDQDVIPSKITVGQWKKNYLEKRGETSISPADYAPFVYDTVWVYIKTLKKLMHLGEKVIKKVRHIFFMLNKFKNFVSCIPCNVKY